MSDLDGCQVPSGYRQHLGMWNSLRCPASRKHSQPSRRPESGPSQEPPYRVHPPSTGCPHCPSLGLVLSKGPSFCTSGQHNYLPTHSTTTGKKCASQSASRSGTCSVTSIGRLRQEDHLSSGGVQELPRQCSETSSQNQATNEPE